ncbi:MAG: hypothetical protein MHM6MM_000746 [Cercozoa sp. M6MM]
MLQEVADQVIARETHREVREIAMLEIFNATKAVRELPQSQRRLIDLAEVLVDSFHNLEIRRLVGKVISEHVDQYLNEKDGSSAVTRKIGGSFVSIAELERVSQIAEFVEREIETLLEQEIAAAVDKVLFASDVDSIIHELIESEVDSVICGKNGMLDACFDEAAHQLIAQFVVLATIGAGR